MKCPSCGEKYSFHKSRCPHCGNRSYVPKEYSNRIAKLLMSPIPMSSVELTFLDFIILLIANASVLSIIANIITAISAGSTVWCQFVICPLLAVYTMLRSSFHKKDKLLRYIKLSIYWILLALNITQFVCGGKIMWAAGYATPIAIILLNITAFVMYLTEFTGTTVFMVTMIVNLFGSLYSLILMWIPYFGKNFGSAETVLVYLAFGTTALLLANFLVIKSMSSFTKIKRIF